MRLSCGMFLLLGVLACQPRNAPPGGATLATQPHGYIKDLRFSHKAHEAHEGAPKNCSGCHQQGRFRRPLMSFCADCHADPAKVGGTALIFNCEHCHDEIRVDKEPVWPRHYGKRGHREYVEKPVVYCAYCHSKDQRVFPIQTSYQNKRDLCNGCHLSEGLGLPGED